MFEFSRRTHGYKRLYLFVSLIAMPCTFLEEIYLQKFIDQESLNYGMFGALMALFSGTFLLRFLKSYVKNRLDHDGTLEGQRSIVEQALQHKTKEPEGTLLYNLTEDVYKMMPWYTSGKLELILEGFYVAFMILLMMSMNFYLTGAAVLFLLISSLLANSCSMAFAKAENNRQKAKSVLNQYIVNTERNVDTIRQLEKAAYFEEQFGKVVEKNYTATLKKTIVRKAVFITQLVFSGEVLPFLVLFLGVVLSFYGYASIGAAIVIMDSMVKISDAIQSIGDDLSQYHLSTDLYRRVQSSIHSGPLTKDGTQSEVPEFKSFDLKIRNGFAPSSQQSEGVPNEFCMKFSRGEIVLLKGKSGTGKSTLAKRMTRMISSDSIDGQILYNGQDFLRFDQKEYNKRVLMAEQNTLLFDGTLLENITMEWQASPDEIREVVAACGLSEFVAEHGLDAPIPYGGENLSSGERQRIGLARLLLRKPDVFILDEPTSALDHELKETVSKGIVDFAKRHDMTLVIICHGEEFDSYCSQMVQLEKIR